ncbi:MarR family winged helix-turn-helix transcriptional regulator [Actinoallomurus rhizosphaericola]|uniref:MarR family winged helix-turn-helix transcriptional regulator n=1 Tax=Actinoallomurus rhizosphaericola TaxID=2952536 RepID=UPI0020932518|nr:MarR family transcriptional regulator [Actinoallomurus rhizosphaericola]MCO6000310.1 MarR family transcriptional regulator [Actinoallomurus rhizosphaericola]
MDDVEPEPFTATLTFRMGILGALITDRLAERTRAYGLKVKHVGMLAALAGSGPMSQLELARLMRVAPSLVVSLADHLEGMKAIQRLRDPDDRRRQRLELTDSGRDLLADCTEAARALGDDLTSSLDADERALLEDLLAAIARAEGLPS